MIKLKDLITENVNVTFKENNELLYIEDQRGEWEVILWTWKKPDGQQIYFWYLGYPARKTVIYRGQKVRIGGSGVQGSQSTNPEQVQADLMNKMKENGLPYIEVMKLKWRDLNRVHKENEPFIQQLQQVQADLKPQNHIFNGTIKDGDYLTSEDIRSGKLQQTINNYGDFWLVIKFAQRYRQQIKASEMVKNYEDIRRGVEANGDYIREVWIRSNPFGDKIK